MPIKTWQERCRTHPDHDGVVSNHMIVARMQEEIDELREDVALSRKNPVDQGASKMKIRTEKIIDVEEWDELVTATYGRVYRFQQQDGCRGRGAYRFLVSGTPEDFSVDSVPEVVNHEKMGVSFAAWLARDPKKPLGGIDGDSLFSLELWWMRNHYPHIQMVANDLHKRGLLASGEYTIDVDW